MIYLNLKNILEAKGIDKPNQYLFQNGISRHNAHRLLNHATASISFKLIEKLCLILNCTPNELFTWSNAAKIPNLDKHAIQTIKYKGSSGNINQVLQQLPVNKLNELRNLVDNLTKDNE
jgi:DNA-binding Xre family transcriptional regulator